MTLAALAAADSQALIAQDCEAVTLTAPAPASTVYAPHALRLSIGVSANGEGLAVIGPKDSITLSIGELAALGITDPETLKATGWTVTARGIVFRFDSPLIDRALGVVTSILKRAH